MVSAVQPNGERHPPERGVISPQLLQIPKSSTSQYPQCKQVIATLASAGARVVGLRCASGKMSSIILTTASATCLDVKIDWSCKHHFLICSRFSSITFLLSSSADRRNDLLRSPHWARKRVYTQFSVPSARLTVCVSGAAGYARPPRSPLI